MILRKICDTTHRTYSMRSFSSKLVVYGDDASPPVRFVLMTAAVLGAELEYKLVDLFKEEHKTEQYKKINPLQKVPALQTGSQVIADSHAIALYLCGRAGRGGRSLLPTEPHRRARVLELLFFNATTLFPIDSYVLTSFFASHWPVTEHVEAWHRALDHLEHKLRDHAWLAGDEMSLCDLCVIATVTSMQTLVAVTRRHERVLQWMRRFEHVPAYHINMRGVERLRSFIDSKNLK